MDELGEGGSQELGFKQTSPSHDAAILASKPPQNSTESRPQNVHLQENFLPFCFHHIFKSLLQVFGQKISVRKPRLPKATMSLPAILCLHGSGVNAKVFAFQLGSLQRLLSKTFEFVFLDAPFVREAGDGVLPFFDGCEPFFRWKSKSDDNTFTHEEIENETKALIEKTLKSRDDWVGILGFSQGGRLAAGWLVEQEWREEIEGEDGGEGFKFGVFLMTPSPPMTTLVYEEGGVEKIRVPSVMIVGKQDSWYESSKKMHAEYFEEESSKLVEFDVGHRLPGEQAAVVAIAREILRLYMLTTGVRGTLSQG
jgi:predicted esterase